jgi:hypothetical protein
VLGKAFFSGVIAAVSYAGHRQNYVLLFRVDLFFPSHFFPLCVPAYFMRNGCFDVRQSLETAAADSINLLKTGLFTLTSGAGIASCRDFGHCRGKPISGKNLPAQDKPKIFPPCGNISIGR